MEIIAKNKLIFSLPIIILAIIAIFLSIKNENSNKQQQNTNALSVYTSPNGQQIIELTAKGGYFPAAITATANLETILRVKTNSTFDCSSSLNIPSLGIRKNLPPTAVTDIPIGSQPSGTEIAGTCSMGMYNFNLVFN